MILDELICNLRKPKNVSLSSCATLKLDVDESKDMECVLLKNAKKEVYKGLGISANTSKEVEKVSKDIWKNLIDKCVQNGLEDESFDFNYENNLYFFNKYNEVVDMNKAVSEEEYERVKKLVEKLNIDLTTNETTNKFFADSKDQTLKLVIYDKNADLPNEEFTPVVVLEMNNVKSTYKVYSGILVYSQFTFFLECNPLSSTDSYYLFLNMFDLEDCMKMSKETAASLYEKYKEIISSEIEVSVRELTQLLTKHCGYKLELRDDNQLDTIQAIQDEDSNRIITTYYNTFEKQTAYDVLYTNELNQIFKYNKLTFSEVLKILSKEYLNYESSKLTADTLSLIAYDLITKNSDKIKIQSIDK